MTQRYLLFQKTEAALIEEKADKLFGITRLLESGLKGDFDDILARARPRPNTRQEKILALNRGLSEFTDFTAKCFPGVGVGYYCRDVDAIVTYGPSSEFGSMVGISMGPGHIGMQAMELGREVVGVGSMVRGEIMNCVRPVIRNGRAVGFVWANETLADIYAQIQLGAKKLFFSPDVQPILGLTGLLLFASRSLLMPSKTPRSRVSSYTTWMNRLHRYLVLFLNSLSLGVLVVDAAGDIIFVSDGMLRIVERQRESLIGTSCAAFLESIGIEHSRVLGANADARNRFVNITLSIPGGPKEITIISTQVGGELGGEEGHVLLFEDLARARADEERFQKAEKLAAVGELATAIAHEIRNPLTIVAGSIQLIPQKLDDREFLVNSSIILGEELARVNGTLEALLNFARFSKPKWVAVDMNALVARSLDVIRAYAAAGSVRIEESYARRIPVIEGDPEHLQQAFLNTMLNALQAMPEGGTLRVTTSRQQGSSYVQITFEDTGAGIPEEEQEKVFDMFYSTKKGGTGLGLPLVQRIVDEHKGYIELQSREGEGTRFTFFLPVQQILPRLAKNGDSHESGLGGISG
ncbi:MAG: ATP-binding protein [Ignavibacteriales bacterium]